MPTRWLPLLTALSLWGFSPSAQAQSHRHTWISRDKGLQFRHQGGGLWREYQKGVRSPHLYYEYQRSYQRIDLYDLKRHIKLRLYRGVSMLKWNFRKDLRTWVLLRWGRWRSKRPKLPKRGAMRPAPRPAPRATSRPSSRPTSRPSSRPAFRRKASSRATSRPHRRAARPVTRRIASRPRPAQSSKDPRRAWLWSQGRRRVQHVAGKLWRGMRRDVLTQGRFLEVQRSAKQIVLFDPEQVFWLRLRPRSMWLRSPKGKWRELTRGRWSPRRLQARSSWVSRRGRYRFHSPDGTRWRLMARGQARGSSFRLVAKNHRFLGLKSRLFQVILYGSRAFVRPAGSRGSWKLLAQGRWDANAPHFPDLFPRSRRTRQPPKRRLRKRPPPRRRAHPAPRRRLAPRRLPPKARPARRLPPKTRPKRRPKVVARKLVPIARKARTKRRKKVRRKAKTRRKDLRKAIPLPKTFPSSAVAFLRIDFKGRRAFASGAMIGDRYLLTVAHAIYDRKKKRYARSVRVYLGLSHRRIWFGSTKALRWIAHPRWITSKKLKHAMHYDLALIALPKALGAKTRWFQLAANRPRDTQGKGLWFYSYPLDKYRTSRRLWQWREQTKPFPLRLRGRFRSQHILTGHRISRTSAGGPLLSKDHKLVGICRGKLGYVADFLRMSPALVRWIQAQLQKQRQLDPRPLPDVPVPDGLKFWKGSPLRLDNLQKKPR